MNNEMLKWIETLYGPWIKVVLFFRRAYRGNRNKIKTIKSRKPVADFLQVAMVVTLAVWLAIWFFATEENRKQLTEEVKHSFQPKMPPAVK